MDSDNVLQRHRARFESHRQWLKEQQASLNSANAEPMLHTPASARSAAASGLAQPVKSGTSSANYGVEAPAYSQAQRVQRTVAAAEWVDQTVHQQSREPLSRDRDESQFHSTSSWAQNQQQQSIPTTARSHGGGSAALQQPPSSRSHPSYEDSRYGLPSHQQQQTNVAHQQHYQGQDGEEEGGGEDDHDGSQHASLVYFEGSPLHVYSRATQWAKRKQQKLIELREAVDSKEVAECPFKPNTAKTRAASGAPSRLQRSFDPSNSYDSNTYDASVASVSGWEEFMCRRLRAKQLQDEKKTRLRSDGSGWTGAPTVVEEFNLGVGVPGRRLQKVLKQPVAAPHGGTRAAVGATLMMPAQGGFSLHGNATTPRGTTVNNYSLASRPNTSSIYASPSPIPRAADVPTDEDHALPPKGLFSLRGSSTFVEGMSNSKAPYSAAEVFA